MLGFGKGFKNRCKDATGGAPLSPEINQYGFVRIADKIIKILIRQYNRGCTLLNDYGGFAFTAQRGLGAIFFYPVLCAACWAFNNDTHHSYSFTSWNFNQEIDIPFKNSFSILPFYD
jgi:hypothetical protein